MLLPIDLIAAILYWSFAAPGRNPGAPARPFDEVWPATLAVFLLALAAAWAASRLTAAAARRRGLTGAPAREAARATMTLYRAFLVLGFVLQVRVIGWPGTLEPPGELLGALVGLGPYLLALALSWIPFRRLDELVTPGRWSAWGHFVFRARTTFFVLLPWLGLLGILDLVVLTLPEDGTFYGYMPPAWMVHAGVLVFLGLAMLLFPALLVRIWGCRRMPEGRLRDRLDELQERAGVRVGRIHLWNLGGGTVLNAAALGVLPPFRYLLLSRALVEHLSEDEVAGVAAHELGHLRHHHVLWYLLVTISFISGVSVIFEAWIADIHLLAAAVALAAALYFRLVFGVLSRHFERQADLFALETLGSAEPLVRSLEKIACLSGDIRDASCWHHSSIAERVAFLRRAEEAPGVVADHHARTRRLRGSLGLASVLILVVVGHTLGTEPAARRAEPPAPYAAFRHWERLMTLLPDDPEPPARLLELARAGRAPRDAVDAERIAAWRAERDRRRAGSR